MKKTLSLISLGLVSAVVLIGITVYSVESYTARSDFCGTSCHIMKKPYVSWQNSKHGQEDIACVECHYAPGEKYSLNAKFKGLGQLFTYLSTDDKEVRKRTHVDDRSCLQSECHIREKFEEKKLQFTEGVSFTHKVHNEKKIPGQTLHCSSCHNHNKFVATEQAEEKHMEVAQESCFLCHFKDMPFAEERAECSMCHEIPNESFMVLASMQNSAGNSESTKSTEIDTDEKLLNHQSLEEKKVPCVSCHLQIVRGTGEVKQSKCLNCHGNQEKIMADWDEKRDAHKNHVTTQTADCFNCHDTIQHKTAPKSFNHIDAALADCRVCHAEPHLFQRQLLSGTGGHGIDEPYPIKHYDVNLNCTGCHTHEALNKKGIPIKQANGDVCVDCHSEKEKASLEKWKSDIDDFLVEARELEAETLESIESYSGNDSDSTFKEAKAMLKNGQENLRIVNGGGGVHNKKFSVYLIDVAIENFEDATDMLK